MERDLFLHTEICMYIKRPISTKETCIYVKRPTSTYKKNLYLIHRSLSIPTYRKNYLHINRPLCLLKRPVFVYKETHIYMQRDLYLIHRPQSIPTYRDPYLRIYRPLYLYKNITTTKTRKGVWGGGRRVTILCKRLPCFFSGGSLTFFFWM